MRWKEEMPGPQQRITGLRHRMQGEESMLTWSWPEGIDVVYVYRCAVEAELPIDARPEQAMKLYTREEYKANGGYRGRVEGIGRMMYRVYPCERTAQFVAAYRQEDEDNVLRFSTGKAKIRCSVKYGFSLLGKTKPARIEIHCDVFVPKEVICYVKKDGAIPLHKDDGMAYPLIHDLVPGRNVLPEIHIPRSSRIRLFLTDGRAYGDIYELISE